MSDETNPGYFDQVHHLACLVLAEMEEQYGTDHKSNVLRLDGTGELNKLIIGQIEDTGVHEEYDVEKVAVTNHVRKQVKLNVL